MPAHAEIDKRMKENYEFPYRFKLTKRMPVIVRIDGKAFHTFTRGFKKPFDTFLIEAMQSTMKYLCENVEGCQFGYTQSDKISLLLVDYKTFNTQAYFDYNVQKIASICASMATLEFNRKFYELLTHNRLHILDANNGELTEEYRSYVNARRTGALFDARCFNIPREEVTNYFFSRQIDASRNSIEMVGRAYFSHKELDEKNGSMIQDMLHEKYNINWNDFPTEQKRGSCCIKENYCVTGDDGIFDTENGPEYLTQLVKRSRWVIDHEIPLFKGDGRQYIEKWVNIDC